jgi:hypothetical protein
VDSGDGKRVVYSVVVMKMVRWGEGGGCGCEVTEGDGIEGIGDMGVSLGDLVQGGGEASWVAATFEV